MSGYFHALVAARRAEPRDDMMTAMLAAEGRADGLSEDELVATCVLLLFAGHETTTNLIGNGIVALLRHPSQLAALAADPRLAASAVEELMRYDGPTQAVTRIAAEDVELRGRHIRRGARSFSTERGESRSGPVCRSRAAGRAAPGQPASRAWPRYPLLRGGTPGSARGPARHSRGAAPSARSAVGDRCAPVERFLRAPGVARCRSASPSLPVASPKQIDARAPCRRAGGGRSVLTLDF